MFVIRCRKSDRSPSRSGQSTKCQWLGIQQNAQMRIGATRSVSSITRSKAA